MTGPADEPAAGAARVTQTGLAVVYTTEPLTPTEGALDGTRTVIHYHFPVEIEVRAAPDPPDAETLIAVVLDRFVTGMENA